MPTSTKPDSTTTELEPFFTDPRSIHDRLHAEAAQWIPHKGDGPALLAGLVLEQGSYTGLDDKVSPTLRLLDGAGVEWSVIAFHGFLRSELERLQIRIGDWVAISYNGTKPAKKVGQSDAHIYKALVERDPSNPLVESGDAAPTTDEPAPVSPPTDDDIPF